MKWIDKKYHSDDLGKEVSTREYMYELLNTLWTEFEGFSGKRPLGNSGWEYFIYKIMIEENIVDGTLDEDGYIEDVDENKAHDIIIKEVLPHIFKIPE